MDINLLVLNLGNSRLSLGAFETGELTYTRRIGVGQRDDWQGVIEEAWRRLADRGGAEVASCVTNPALVDALERACEAATGQRPQQVGRDIDLPIAVRTQVPEKTGVDRILNVAAAHEQLGKACCVVDAGTAVTVDFCDDAGAFLGGVIAPGARAQFEALARVAPHLPELKLEKAVASIGNDTESAIKGGVFHGIRGLVRHVVEEHAMTLDAWPEVIATGGDAAVLFDGWELVHAVSPDLTLYGVALAYTQHHIRHGT